MKLMLGKCRKHGILGCAECFASLKDEIWKKEEEGLSKRIKAPSNGQPQMACPICHSEMKVNIDFQMAKCQNNPCGFVVNWSSMEQMLATTLRIGQAVMGRRRQ